MNISAITSHKTSPTRTLQITMVCTNEICLSQYGLLSYRNNYRYAWGVGTYNLQTFHSLMPGCSSLRHHV